MQSEGDTALIRSLHTCDDGCDWAPWCVWNMGSRRRISEHRFELPPVRPQVVSPTIKPRKKVKRRTRKKTGDLTCL